MKIAVCEDNMADMDMICGYIKSYCNSNRFSVEIDSYNCAEALLKEYPKEKYQVVFLDIVIGGLSGIDAAKKIRTVDTSCTIVFVTMSEGYSLDAYAVDGAAYVLKPVNHEGMNRALNKCRREFMKSSSFITVSTQRHGMVNIPLNSISYLEVYNKKVIFHLGTKTITTMRMTLDEIEEKLGGEPFLRCHRSYIVNMNKAVSLKNGEFKMNNGDTLVIPVRKQAEVQLKFGNYLTQKLSEDILAQ